MMVNAKKHRKLKEGDKKTANPEDLQELELAILNVIINQPDRVLKELEVTKKRYNRLIKKLIADKGAFITSESCSNLMEEMFKVDFTLETVKLYYYAITLPSRKLEEVKTSLEETFKLLMKIQKLQNRNLDNKNYFGFGSAIFTEAFKKVDKLSKYTTKEHEDLLRLKINYKKPNPEFTEKSIISL